MGRPIAELRFTGLKELRKAMRDAEAGSQKHLQIHFKDVAVTVASAVAGQVPTSTGKKGKNNTFSSGSAAASVRARATQTSAGIVAGGPKAPYFPWLDFGGSVGRGHVAGQGDSGAVKRPFMKAGRYIYPTITDMSDVIVDAASEGIGDALREAGWEPD